MKYLARLKCLFGRHKWLYGGSPVYNDLDYWGPLHYVVACPRCGKRKFWEGG